MEGAAGWEALSKAISLQPSVGEGREGEERGNAPTSDALKLR